MAISERLKNAANALFRPAAQGNQGSNAAVLRQLFDEANAAFTGNRGSWHPRYSAGSGVRTQWEHKCNCGLSFTLLESEKYRAYTCSRCKHPFDFAGDVGIRLSKNKELRAATLKFYTGVLTEADWSRHDDTGDWLPEDKQEILLGLLHPLPAKDKQYEGPIFLPVFDEEYTAEWTGAKTGIGTEANPFAGGPGFRTSAGEPATRVVASIDGEKEARDYAFHSYVATGTVPYGVRQRIATEARRATHTDEDFKAEVEKRTAAWRAEVETRTAASAEERAE